MNEVKIVGKKGAKYPLKSVGIVKGNGMSSSDSYLVNGLAVKIARATPMMVKNIAGGCKIACLDFDLKKFKGQMGVDIIVKNPAELEAIRNQEEVITKQRIQMIIDSGATVVLTTKGMDDLAMKYFVEAGIIGVRRVPKIDMQRIAKATGATLVVSLGTLDGDEAFEAENLGTADNVGEEMLGDYEMMLFKGCQTSKAVTIVLRGPNEDMLDEMERSMHDALMVVKRVLETKKVVPGGGCVEAAISVHLEDYAKTLGTKEQEAVSEFAQALLVIPTTLAVNAAVDAADLVAQLRAAHYKSQQEGTSPEEAAALKLTGLDLVAGVVCDNLAKGVVEPALSKLKQIRFATEAAVTIMRIDDMITINPKQAGPPGGRQ
jgi:T-complex protein 1 subunit alpha